MGPKERMQDIMSSMSQGRVRPLFDAMAEDVTWRWMGVRQWSRTFVGRQLVVDTLFGGAWETLSPSSSVEVHGIHGDGDFVVERRSLDGRMVFQGVPSARHACGRNLLRGSSASTRRAAEQPG
jgi:ketosteroid isomerase-like protein